MNGLSVAQFVALIVPLALVQLGLMALAVRDLVKTDRVEDDRKWLWGIVIVVFGLIGPVLYFLIGRREE